FAVARAHDDPAVFSQCTAEFEAGCWHGVMEGYFTSRRAAPAAAVMPHALDTLCAAIAPAGPARLPVLECAHGMGHGLTALTQDVAKTAQFCARAPAGAVAACLHGFGKQSTGWFDTDTDVLTACRFGDAHYLGACMAGAAESYIDETWTPTRALGLCRRAPN